MQTIISGDGCYKNLKGILRESGSRRPMLVCDAALDFLPIKDYLADLDMPLVRFREFTANPKYEEVVAGVTRFIEQGCDCIIAVGGGSAIDVAKCIKLFWKMDREKNYLSQEYFDSGTPLIALPTTAGTGSESTRFAVVYMDGRKQSISHPSILPHFALLDAGFLKTLPLYQKKCTLLDALCQGIESWWSVNSTKESREYSRSAVSRIMSHYKAYIFGDDDTAREEIMLASNLSGRAINIAKTTAPHAMSYKLTSIYSLPHGGAVAVCLPKVWRYMLDNISLCRDPRGEKHLLAVFEDISSSLGCHGVCSAIDKFEDILRELDISSPTATSEELKELVSSVNPERLKNNPVELRDDVLTELYKNITGAKI